MEHGAPGGYGRWRGTQSGKNRCGSPRLRDSRPKSCPTHGEREGNTPALTFSSSLPHNNKTVCEESKKLRIFDCTGVHYANP